MRYFQRVLAWGVIVFGSQAVVAQVPSAEELYGSLQKAVRELERCHVVAAKRGDSVALNGAPPHLDVHFVDLWIDGDALQAIEQYSTPNEGPDWWRGFPGTDAPLTTETADSVDGRKVCFSPSREIIWADYIQIPETRQSPYKTLYSTSPTARPVTNLFVPLIELNRAWALQDRSGEWPIVNLLSLCPLENWQVIGEESLDGQPTVKVAVTRAESIAFPLKRHAGELKFVPLWNCWFSTAPGHVPLKIESSVRYQYQGKDYPYERAGDHPPLMRYLASDIQNAFGDVWFPFRGEQETYVPDYPKISPFDPDAAVDTLLKSGRYLDEDPYLRNTRREWTIIALEPFQTADPLWFDPPKGACVRDMATGAIRIEGLSAEESQKVLGASGPQDIPHPPQASQGSRRRAMWILIGVNAVIVAGLVCYFAKRRSHNA